MRGLHRPGLTGFSQTENSPGTSVQVAITSARQRSYVLKVVSDLVPATTHSALTLG